jgi:hypothetical protein
LAGSRPCIQTVDPWPRGVNGVVVGQVGVPEDRPPEADVDRIGLGRDGELHLLRQGAVGRGSVFPSHRRYRLSQLNMPLLQQEDAARQSHGELAIGERHKRAVQSGDLRHRLSQPGLSQRR